jgi:hypothetical protein
MVAGQESGQRGQLQGAIDQIQQQLMQAQMTGANPMVIADLQAQLQGAQRAFQEAGLRAQADLRGNMPQAGPTGIGGVANPYDAGRMQDWTNQMQLLQGLWGMGGGGGYGPQIG